MRSSTSGSPSNRSAARASIGSDASSPTALASGCRSRIAASKPRRRAEVEEPIDPLGKRCQQHLLGDEPVRYLARQVLGDPPRLRPLPDVVGHSREVGHPAGLLRRQAHGEGAERMKGMEEALPARSPSRGGASCGSLPPIGTPGKSSDFAPAVACPSSTTRRRTRPGRPAGPGDGLPGRLVDRMASLELGPGESWCNPPLLVHTLEPSKTPDRRGI